MRPLPTSTAIFRPPTAAEVELARLRAKLSSLRLQLSLRERELDELRRHLLSFEGRYIRKVGKLYKQLDEWEQRVAALHPEREAELVAALEEDEDDQSPSAAQSSGSGARTATKDTQPAVTLRLLFRELALRIHPDHATDADDEQRRTRLMAQANDAFRRKDLRILRRMLHGFNADDDLPTLSLDQQLTEARESIKQSERDLAAVVADHAALAGSQLAELECSAIDAARAGRDLLAEMAARVQGRIGLVMRQYELDLSRLKRPSRGFKVESLLSASTHPERR